MIVRDYSKINFYNQCEKVRIYDYVDRNVPMLLNMFKKRLKGSRALGYEIGGERIR